MEKIKYVHRQDCGFKLSAGNSGETSLNLSNEIFDLIAKGSMQQGEEKDVTFKIYKEDCIKAICFIILKLPLYQSSSNSSTKIEDGISIFQKLIDKVNSIFGDKECVDYTVNLYYRTDGRIYLNRLKVDGFSIRDVLVENNSALLFKEEPGGQIALRILSDIQEGEDKKAERIINDRTLSTFILSVISYFDKEKGLTPIATYAQNVNRGNPIKVSAPNLFNLVGMFIETSIEDIRSRNSDHTRWFEKEFEFGGKKVYLSTQWNAKGNYQLTLPDFIKLIRHCYGEIYSYKFNNGVHELYVTRENGADLGPRPQILFQFDDATKFVWECIKLFNKNKELKQLLSSDYRTNGGSMGNYIRINDCFVAQLGQIDIEGFESIYTDEEGYINNGFDARDIEKFAEAVNDVYKGEYQVVIEGDNYKLIKLQLPIDAKAEFTPYLTALRTKPFMLLAGISGTGKSRIAREIAKACWPEGSKQRTAHMPENYCIVSVKPNWHDSTELIGYVSRINGKEKYVYGDFLPFVVKAWMNPSVPHILCLDEMNLAPVEQYFAEYLSAIESRESNNGVITTDPILKPVFSRDADGNAVVEQWYSDLIKSLLAKCPNETIYALTKQFEDNGITIPQNLFVIGTVNMDETTFSFSRKVLDRAMTLEMNKVDLEGGLAKDSLIGPRYIGGEIIGDKAKGADAYEANKALCDKVIEYLKKINDALENTPFKIAYRTRNEFLLYAVNRLAIDKKSEVWQTLDEMTSMKILSRIEGDEDRCKACLAKIDEILAEFLCEHFEESVSHKKIKEMQGKFKSGYTSYWT